MLTEQEIASLHKLSEYLGYQIRQATHGFAAHVPEMKEHREHLDAYRKAVRAAAQAKPTAPGMAVQALAAEIVDALRAEVESLRKDAERLRWVIGGVGVSARWDAVWQQWDGFDGPAGFIAAIDAAITKGATC